MRWALIGYSPAATFSEFARECVCPDDRARRNKGQTSTTETNVESRLAKQFTPAIPGLWVEKDRSSVDGGEAAGREEEEERCEEADEPFRWPTPQ